jgi:hypothetical protein
MKNGHFSDYETFLKAQKIHVETQDDYEFIQELTEEEKFSKK